MKKMKRPVLAWLLFAALLLSGCGRSAAETKASDASVQDVSETTERGAGDPLSEEITADDYDTLLAEFAKDVRSKTAYARVWEAMRKVRQSILSSDASEEEKEEQLAKLTEQEYLNEVAAYYRIPLELLDISMFFDTETGAFYNPFMEGGPSGYDLPTRLVAESDGATENTIPESEYIPEDEETIDDASGTAEEGEEIEYRFFTIHPGQEFILPGNTIELIDPDSPIFLCDGERVVLWTIEYFPSDQNFVYLNGVKIRPVYEYEMYDPGFAANWDVLLKEDVWLIQDELLVEHTGKAFPFNTAPVQLWETVSGGIDTHGHVLLDNYQGMENRAYESNARIYHELGYSWEELTYQNYWETIRKENERQSEEFRKKAMEEFAQLHATSSLPETEESDFGDGSAEESAVPDEEAEQETTIVEGVEIYYMDGDPVYTQQITGDVLPIDGKIPTTCETWLHDGHDLVTLRDDSGAIVTSADMPDEWVQEYLSYPYVYFTMLSITDNGYVSFMLAGSDSPVSGNLSGYQYGDIDTDAGTVGDEMYWDNGGY